MPFRPESAWCLTKIENICRTLTLIIVSHLLSSRIFVSLARASSGVGDRETRSPQRITGSRALPPENR
jgi:hypothetical protein